MLETGGPDKRKFAGQRPTLRPAFTWGGVSIVHPGELRSRYLQALRAADAGDIRPILKFARS